MKLFKRNSRNFVDIPKLARAVIYYREENCLTQTELAELIDYTQDNISKIETCKKKNIARSTIQKFQSLGIEINYL